MGRACEGYKLHLICQSVPESHKLHRTPLARSVRHWEHSAPNHLSLTSLPPIQLVPRSKELHSLRVYLLISAPRETGEVREASEWGIRFTFNGCDANSPTRFCSLCLQNYSSWTEQCFHLTGIESWQASSPCLSQGPTADLVKSLS